ncbi:MAG: energy-coupling factor transport system ATP-binding protein [Solirubrobacteraceae bacterium]|nr:energy-coupling factor transport system ATP-binding protein [Solirubrobacteraceae bacterium]
MSVLAFDAVTYTYPQAGEPALRDLTFAVEPGEFCVVAGLTAGGKSTLLRAACGLAPHFHGGTFAGRITVGGLDTRDHGPGDIAAVAGTLFQDPETQILMGTVRAELAFPLENRGYGAAAVARGVEEAALALGIERLLERTTRELSGGELQRVALAAALAGRPELVLLDEPTSQLDPVAGDELISLLRRLNEQWGTAVVMIEHRLERCLAAADRVLVLAGGALACDAAPGPFLDWAAQAAPALQTPGARLFACAGMRPAPAGVKDARATLRAHGLLPDPRPPGTPADPRAASDPDPGAGVAAADPRPPADPGPPGPGRADRSGDGAPKKPPRWRRGEASPPAALRLRGVWHELADGPAILRGVDLDLAPGETVALMGRNGAGKSTLLRHAHGLSRPTRGRVDRAGRVALLLQNPGDYFLADRVGDELAGPALAAAGLDGLADRHPRDLSGGERQRLALAIVAGDGEPPAVVCLDEPTRGMDRAAKGELADRLGAYAAAGAAVLVATHDAEFAAAFAARVVLLADGRVIADGPVAEILSGGWYFATETARILGGDGGALLPEQGGALLRRRLTDCAPRWGAELA